jgi:uncharacterized protein YecE (DUF72 family)
MAVARVGISGWTYAPWRGVFYPKGLPHRAELEYASSKLDSIEINGSFYALQKPTSYRHWAESTPDRFVFAVKGGRYITHILRLRNTRTALANFFASGVLALGDKLGPFLWQLPPNLPLDPEALDAFLALLPATAAEARTLAAETTLEEDRTELTSGGDRVLRHAVEARHASFADPAFARIARDHGVAWCWRTPLADIRYCGRSPPTSSTCASTATRSSTRAGTPTRRSTAGPRSFAGGWTPGSTSSRTSTTT